MVPNVLVVEPYADLRAGIVSALQRIEYACDAVASAGEAVLKLQDTDYTYVILDLGDGDSVPMSDLATSLELHGNVILITDADPRDVDARDATVLRKPFAREELVAHFAH